MDEIERLCKNWNDFGKTDPLWAIASRKEKKGNKWDIDEFFQSGKTQIDQVLRELQLTKIEFGTTIALDFGCGVGRLTQALANHFDRVVGVDIAPSMIELAQKYNRFGDRCQYYVNQKNNLSIFEENTFDLIYSADVLQHMDPKIAKIYLEDFLRVLSPKGVLVFQMPSDNSNTIRKVAYQLGVSNRAMRLISWLKRSPFMEYHYISKDNMENIISEYGGTVRRAILTPRSNGVISYHYIVTKE